MVIKKFKEYSSDELFINDFINSFYENSINESASDMFKKAWSKFKKSTFMDVVMKIWKDFRSDFKMSLTFGMGISAFFPIVDKLMKNMNINSFDLSEESIVLLTITSFTIIYIGEKNLTAQQEENYTKYSKYLLEELKLRGIGNGIVKKMIKCINSIKNIFDIIARHMGATIYNIVEMFEYTAIFIPMLNGVMYIIGKYELNVDTMIQNFIGLGIGVSTIISKNGIKYILNKINGVDKKEILNEIDPPAIQKFNNFGNADEVEHDGDLIKEQ